MSKYIDSEKLIAEIERRIESWTIQGKHSPAGQGRDTCESRVTELSDLLSFTTSLQREQPEVDLDAEITKENEKWTCYEEFGFGSKYDAHPFDGRDIDRIARHFYELGKNARKEEQYGTRRKTTTA